MTTPNPITDPLAVEWLAHQRHHGVPANTILRRAATLKSLPTASTATREDVEAWWHYRAHLAPATRSSDLANLRAFYKWAQRWEHRQDDPTTRIDAPKVPNGVPRPVARADLLRLLDTLPADLRRACCLAAYAGLRVAEAATLRWVDVDVEARRARVLGKGAKTRVVALSPVLIDALLPITGGNVVTGRDKGIAPNVLQRRLSRAMKAAGVNATPHQLRHRYGTLAYQATGDLLAVGRQMGHSSPVSTAIYAATSEEVADRIAAAVVR